MSRAWIRTLSAVAVACLLGTASAQQSFDQVLGQIAVASADTIDQLSQLRASGTLDANTSLGVIQKNVSPFLDYAAMTRLAMGKHWRDADDAQRAKATEEFQILLEKTYANTFARFDDQKLNMLEPVEQSDGSQSVPFELSEGRAKATIEYIMENSDGWKVTDVKVEKISLVSNYRRQFDSIIRRNGIDGLIEALTSKNRG